jgi:uncharacterized repeat protein (TIGR02543 family)
MRIQSFKKWMLFIFAQFIIFAFFSLSIGTIPSFDIVKNEVLYPVSSIEEAEQIAFQYDLQLNEITSYHLALYQVPENRDITALISAGFLYNSIMFPTAPPWQDPTLDPYLSQQYGLEITQTDDAWAYSLGSSAIVIAIIDTGIDIDHPEFVGRISSLSYNVPNNVVGINAVNDDQGHGTMVAGVIGAIKDNSIGIAGITQNTQLMVIKANENGAEGFKESNVIKGIYYAVDNGAHVINLSLGSTYFNTATETAINYATSQGVFVVAASGNDGETSTAMMYPASYENTISVGAVDKTKTIAPYSNYNTQVDLAAPGTGIVTTAIDGYTNVSLVSGTSFAAPHVAGIIALYLSLYPQASIAEVKTRLYGTAEDLGDAGLDIYYGYGLINAFSLITSSYHKITFVTPSSTLIEPLYVESGETFTLPQAPEMTDQIFIGWFYDALFNEPFDALKMVTADVTLYAKYVDASHTITFVTGGESIEPMIVAHGDTLLLPLATKPGYTFNGWFLDLALTIPYEPHPIENDLTLYAGFIENPKVTVTLIDDDILIATLMVDQTVIYETTPLEKEGYDFIGWYLDPSFNESYQSQYLENNITLYAKWQIKTYQIQFVTEGDSIDPLFVIYGEDYSLPISVKQGFNFIGWYLNSALTELYVKDQIKSDLILYAKFEPILFKVAMYQGETLIESVSVGYGTLFTAENLDVKGMNFEGWYYDLSFMNAYVAGTLTSDISLYAKMSPILYTFNFYGIDQLTLLDTLQGYYGEVIDYPTFPPLLSSVNLGLNFVGWNLDHLYETTINEIYPIIEVTFYPDTVRINPSLDTLYQGSLYQEQGLNIIDGRLSVKIVGSVNVNQVGRYVLSYQVHYNDNFLYEYSRVVNIIALPALPVITLNKGVTTLFKNQPYQEAGAKTTKGTVEIIGTVDTSVPGVYTILYQVEYAGNIVQLKRYVFVLETQAAEVVVVAYIDKKEDEWIA